MFLTTRLNAPYGAWCFLTESNWYARPTHARCLNAPYGAWCFLTYFDLNALVQSLHEVLMHLMALGAF